MASARLSLFLVCVAFFMLKTAVSGVPLTRVKSAVAKGAVCLDGSPPAYQFDKGFGEGANSWLLNLEGGEWCGTPKDCIKRTNYPNGLGSSFRMTKHRFTGILSKKQIENPNTATDPHSPEIRKESIRQGTKLFYRGARIFDAIVEKLLEVGMSKASNALLSGNSAGGLASILHCDRFRAFLPATTTKVKCLSDGGYFMHVRDISGKYHFEEGSIKNLPRACTLKMKRGLIPRILALTNIDVGRSWSISEAVGDWYYDRAGAVQLIDHRKRWPHVCVLDVGEPNRILIPYELTNLVISLPTRLIPIVTADDNYCVEGWPQPHNKCHGANDGRCKKACKNAYGRRAESDCIVYDNTIGTTYHEYAECDCRYRCR
ncbi:hypothetical protein LguiB_009665 [Lonicera macranthoides]